MPGESHVDIEKILKLPAIGIYFDRKCWLTTKIDHISGGVPMSYAVNYRFYIGSLGYAYCENRNARNYFKNRFAHRVYHHRLTLLIRRDFRGINAAFWDIRRMQNHAVYSCILGDRFVIISYT